MDVKSSNILMDEALEGKMSDFGISRQNFNDTNTGQLATNLVATRGYVDPEYALLPVILFCQ
jgi:serine/threonine protein kinase